MKNVYILLFAAVASGCDRNGEPMHNSIVTDRVLDHFAAGLRFGDSFEVAAQRGSVVDSEFDESGSTIRLELPSAKHGLSSVRLLGTASTSGRPESARIYAVIVFSRADSARVALTSAKVDAQQIFEGTGQQGCIGYSPQHTSPVTVWGDIRSGGMALIEPVHDRPSTDEALTRLVVYPRGKRVADVLPEFRTTGCQN